MDIFSITENSTSLRIFSRLFSLFCLISILFSIKYLLSKLRVNSTFSYLIIALIFISTFPWYSISRPDVLLMLLLILAIIYINNLLKYLSIKTIVILSGIFAISIFVKQTALILIPVVVLTLLFLRKFKASALLSLFTGGFSLIIFYLISSLGYDLTFLNDNIYKGLENGINLNMAIEMSYLNYIIYFLPISFVMIIVVILTYQKIKLNPFTLFIILINIFTFIIACFLALKNGSAIHYFNESIIFQLILFGIAFEKLNVQQKTYAFIFLTIIGIQITFIHLATYRWQIINFVSLKTHANLEYEIEIKKFLKANLGNSHFVTNVRSIALNNVNTVAIFAYDIHQFCFQERAFDYSNLQNSILTGDIKYLIESENIESLFDIKIKNHFRLIGQIGPYKILQYETLSN